MEDKKEFDILEKLLSGRFIATVVISLVFAYATYASILTSEQVNSVIMLVIAFYFSKKVKKN